MRLTFSLRSQLINIYDLDADGIVIFNVLSSIEGGRTPLGDYVSKIIYIYSISSSIGVVEHPLNYLINIGYIYI